MAPDSSYVQPWRNLRERLRYVRLLLASDIVVFPGFFHFKTLPLHHWLRRLTLKPVVLWSEPIHKDPTSAREGRVKGAIRRILLKPCNSKRYHLLAIGVGAEDDFRRLGMDRWTYYQFLFTVAQGPGLRHAGRSADEIGLAYCGSLVDWKGVDLLVEALSTLSEVPWALTIIGDGPAKEDLEQMARDRKIDARITFTGILPPAECYRLLAAHDALVLPSRYDGWGAVVNEAMECGLAVVVSDRVGARRLLVTDGENGYLFRGGSPADLASKLEPLCKDRALVARMQQQSWDKIQGYRPERVAAQFGEFCHHLSRRAPYDSLSDVLKRI